MAVGGWVLKNILSNSYFYFFGDGRHCCGVYRSKMRERLEQQIEIRFRMIIRVRSKCKSGLATKRG